MAGRPTAFKPEFVEQSKKLCRLGATDKEMADFFGVDERTINRWKEAHPEFCQSLKEGKIEADANVADRLYQRAMGYTHEAVKIFANPTTGDEKLVPFVEHYAPDTTACIFWLKNRRPAEWRDKIETDTKITTGDPLTTLLERVAESGRKIHGG